MVGPLGQIEEICHIIAMNIRIYFYGISKSKPYVSQKDIKIDFGIPTHVMKKL